MKIFLHKKLGLGILLALAFVTSGRGQGFQNLDFEDGIFIPIPGDPFNSVEWAAAMPGWTGYVGTDLATAPEATALLHNDLFLSLAGISIHGPNANDSFLHGQYYIQLQTSFPFPPNPIVGCALAQTGTIPTGTQSIQFWNLNPYIPNYMVTFDGQEIPLVLIGTAANGSTVWGGDVSAYAGLTGELRFGGASFLDNIQFSPVGIPEPSVLSLFGLGVLGLAWQRRRNSSRV